MRKNLQNQKADEDYNMMFDSVSQIDVEKFVNLNCKISCEDLEIFDEDPNFQEFENCPQSDYNSNFQMNRAGRNGQKIQSQVDSSEKIEKKRDQTFLQSSKVNSQRYRQRKKQAYLRLCDQNKKYKEIVEEQRKKILSLEQQLHTYKYASCKEKVNFQKQQLEARKLLLSNKDQVGTESFAEILKEVSSKYGPAGNDRKEVLNYYMSEFMDSSLNDMQKCFLMYALKSQGLLKNTSQTCVDLIENKLKFPTELLKQLKSQNCPEIVKVSCEFLQISKDIYRLYLALVAQAEKMQRIIRMRTRTTFFPVVISTMEWLIQNQFSQQMCKIKQDWFLALKENDIEESKLLHY